MTSRNEGAHPASIATHEFASLLSPCIVPSSSPRATFFNWARTFKCHPQKTFVPTTIYECRLITEWARREGKTLRAAGVGHSPSDLACTDEWMIRMDGMKEVIETDVENKTVTVQGGITLEDLHEHLLQEGLALHNNGSITEQTLAGIIATATHGSGFDYPVISSHVLALDLISSAEGAEIVHCSREQNRELFLASLCGLGMTGLIVQVKLEVEPAFRLRESKVPVHIDYLLGTSLAEERLAQQSVVASDEKTPLVGAGDDVHFIKQRNEQSMQKIEDIAKSAEHVRMWWYPQTGGVIVARANRTYEPPIKVATLFGNFFHYHVTQFFLWLATFVPRYTSLVGKWAWWLNENPVVQQDHSYKVFTFDCLYPQYTTEWAIPMEKTRDVLAALRDWLTSEEADPKGQRVHFPIEIRFTAPDDIWLSPCYGRQTTYIGIVQYRPYRKSVPYEQIFDKFSHIMAEHDGRPHWAKQHGFTADTLRQTYEKYDDFFQVVRQADPEGRWRCGYTQRHFGDLGAVPDGKCQSSSEEGERHMAFGQ
ncbi:D-arabinono-1,4-lactone oxidase [Naganishia albida]|nr:D-arabinono-1,4-lactone oxidase [Naganishia albida]